MTTWPAWVLMVLQGAGIGAVFLGLALAWLAIQEARYDRDEPREPGGHGIRFEGGMRVHGSRDRTTVEGAHGFRLVPPRGEVFDFDQAEAGDGHDGGADQW